MLNLILSGTKIETKWIVIVIAIAIILVGLILFLIFKPKKKNEEETKEENKMEDVIDSKETIEEETEEVTNEKENETIVQDSKPNELKETHKNNINEGEKEEMKETKVEEKQKKQVYGKYEVFPAGKYFLYRLKASNGETLVVSEIYKTFNGVRDAIETVKKNIETGTLIVNQEKHGLWQFKLYSINKRLLVESANYETKARCESACESFKRFAFISPVVNLEKDTENLLEPVTLTKEADKAGGKLVLDDYQEGSENAYKLIASNGHVLCTSIPYKTNQALLSSLDGLKETFETGALFLFKDKNDTYFFKLYNTSGRISVYGESYKTKANALSAANSAYSFITLATKELPENFK